MPNEDLTKRWEHWKRESKICPISSEDTEDIACFPCGHVISVESYKKPAPAAGKTLKMMEFAPSKSPTDDGINDVIALRQSRNLKTCCLKPET